jgi:hypothetical protein
MAALVEKSSESGAPSSESIAPDPNTWISYAILIVKKKNNRQ